MLDQWRIDNTDLRRYYEWRGDTQQSFCFHDLQKRFSNNLNTHFRCVDIILPHLCPASYTDILIIIILIKWITLLPAHFYYAHAHAHSFARTPALTLSLSVCHHAFAAQWVECSWKSYGLKHVAKRTAETVDVLIR